MSNPTALHIRPECHQSNITKVTDASLQQISLLSVQINQINIVTVRLTPIVHDADPRLKCFHYLSNSQCGMRSYWSANCLLKTDRE